MTNRSQQRRLELEPWARSILAGHSLPRLIRIVQQLQRNWGSSCLTVAQELDEEDDLVCAIADAAIKATPDVTLISLEPDEDDQLAPSVSDKTAGMCIAERFDHHMARDLYAGILVERAARDSSRAPVRAIMLRFLAFDAQHPERIETAAEPQPDDASPTKRGPYRNKPYGRLLQWWSTKQQRYPGLTLPDGSARYKAFTRTCAYVAVDRGKLGQARSDFEETARNLANCLSKDGLDR